MEGKCDAAAMILLHSGMEESKAGEELVWLFRRLMWTNSIIVIFNFSFLFASDSYCLSVSLLG